MDRADGSLCHEKNRFKCYQVGDALCSATGRRRRICLNGESQTCGCGADTLVASATTNGTSTASTTATPQYHAASAAAKNQRQSMTADVRESESGAGRTHRLMSKKESTHTPQRPGRDTGEDCSCAATFPAWRVSAPPVVCDSRTPPSPVAALSTASSVGVCGVLRGLSFSPCAQSDAAAMPKDQRLTTPLAPNVR